MIYSEPGRVPMSIIRKIRIVTYWVKILKTNNCIVKTLYDVMFMCKHESSKHM